MTHAAASRDANKHTSDHPRRRRPGGDITVKPINPPWPNLDPARIDQAMAVWGTLTAGEQREVFLSAYRSSEAFRITGDPEHAVRLAQGVTSTVELEQLPGFTEARRRPPVPPREQGEGIGMEALCRMLREPDAS